MARKPHQGADGAPREERVAELSRSDADRDAALEERAQPARPDQAEPAGEQDPAAEREIEEATARPEEVEGASTPSTAPEATGSKPAAEAEAAVEEAPPPADAPPEDPLALAERKRDEYLALAQRTQADFENYRRRAAKDAAAAGARAKGGLVRELLPVVDNLERALASAEQSEQHLAEGVRLVHAELLAVLARHGVEAYDPAGESFDPAVHEALSVRSEEGAEAGVVLDVVEKGYKLDGSVLRPARVVVSG